VTRIQNTLQTARRSRQSLEKLKGKLLEAQSKLDSGEARLDGSFRGVDKILSKEINTGSFLKRVSHTRGLL
jgi:hypothetical protein